MNGNISIKKKINILFIIPYFVPAWNFGGPVRKTYELANNLISKGHTITVLTTDVYKKETRIKHEKCLINGIRIIYLKNWNNYIAYKFIIPQPRKIRKWLKQHIKDFDIIHIQEINTIMTYWAYKFALKEKKPFIISTNGVLSTLAQQRKKIFKKFFNLFLRRCLKKASKIVAQTSMEKEDINKFGFSNIAIINNGVNLDEFKVLPKREIFREKQHINDDEIMILFLGRIDEIKGLKYLVEAINKIEEFPLKLVIIGPTEKNYKNLIKLIKSNKKVIFIDGLYDKAKLEAFASADIFCLPSLYDCAPNSMLEACACGLPIITTYNNGLYRIVNKGAGILVKSRSSKEIRDAILFLIKNQDLRRKMGLFAKNIVFSKFSWDKITDDLLKIYFELV